MLSYLEQKKAVDKNHSHVSVGPPYGRFLFGNMEHVWPMYLEALARNDYQLHLAERPLDQIPVLVDVDLSILMEKTVDLPVFQETQKIYSQFQVEKVISTYQNVLRTIVKDLREEALTCILLEKPFYEKKIDTKIFVKNGFHLHFPKLFLDKKAQEVYLIPNVKKHLINLFANIECDEPIDCNYVNVHWLMYGSSKEGNVPYKVSKCFNSHGKEIDLEECLSDYILPQETNGRMSCIGNVEILLPRILSIFLTDRENFYYYECNDSVSTPLIQKYQERKNLRKQFDNLSMEDVLDEAAIFVEMISDSRADDRISWLEIGFCLFNISQGDADGLTLWLEFSERSSKFKELECIWTWENMKSNNFTIGTLKYFAKQDSPEKFEHFIREKQKTKIVEHISNNGSHNALAKVLFDAYSSEFKFDSSWYQFVNHIWEQNFQVKNFELRKRISDKNGVICQLLHNAIAEVSNQMLEDDADVKELKKKIKKGCESIQSCQNTVTKGNVMSEAEETFYEKGFADQLNANPKIIAFQNGVYDFTHSVFRPGKPEDYLSKALPINYVNFKSINHQKVIDVLNFFEKVFPNPNIRNYFLDQMCKVFVGGNHDKLFLFWTGVGDNGKSVTQSLFKTMLGPFAIKCPTTLITGKQVQAGSANPELSRAGDGTRCIVMDEPNSSERINAGTLKMLTGNDTFFARDNYETAKKNKDKVPFFKLHMICNKIPKIKDPDAATWERIRVIPFESVFKLKKDCPASFDEQLRTKTFPKDPSFCENLPEMVEALAWFLINRYNNLSPDQETPLEVLSAVDSYIAEHDIFMTFENAKVFKTEGATLQKIVLWEEFKRWFKEEFDRQNFPPQSQFLDYFYTKWGKPENDLYWNDKTCSTDQH
jgi:P4 family phage/plasmid primase-like protien